MKSPSCADMTENERRFEMLDSHASPEAIGQMVVRVVRRLTRQLLAEMHCAPEARKLTWPQFRTLSYLSEHEYRASELAAALEIGRSTLTAVSSGLVRRGLIEREHDLLGDRRGVLLRLTSNGRALHAILQARAVSGVASMLTSASPAEWNALAVGLAALERGMNCREQFNQVLLKCEDNDEQVTAFNTYPMMREQ